MQFELCLRSGCSLTASHPLTLSNCFISLFFCLCLLPGSTGMLSTNITCKWSSAWKLAVAGHEWKSFCACWLRCWRLVWCKITLSAFAIRYHARMWTGSAVRIIWLLCYCQKCMPFFAKVNTFAVHGTWVTTGHTFLYRKNYVQFSSATLTPAVPVVCVLAVMRGLSCCLKLLVRFAGNRVILYRWHEEGKQTPW